MDHERTHGAMQPFYNADYEKPAARTPMVQVSTMLIGMIIVGLVGLVMTTLVQKRTERRAAVAIEVLEIKVLLERGQKIKAQQETDRLRSLPSSLQARQ